MSPLHFTPEFKEEAARQITERGYSVAEISAGLGVSAHTAFTNGSVVLLSTTIQIV